MPWEYLYYMATIQLRRSPAEFWAMTLRELDSLITEWSRMEEMQGQAMASRIAYATVMMQNGKMPEWNQDKKKTVIDNDSAFMNM